MAKSVNMFGKSILDRFSRPPVTFFRSPSKPLHEVRLIHPDVPIVLPYLGVYDFRVVMASRRR